MEYTKCVPPRESEFGKIIAYAGGGSIHQTRGGLQFISPAFHGLTAQELLELSELLVKLG